jgi:peptide-methionine (R)-S-oxide reductase
MLSRRSFFLAGGVAGLALAAGLSMPRSNAAASQVFEVTHTDEEWRSMLTPEEYYVLREAGTERPFTSPLLDEHRNGTFNCAGCSNKLFTSDTKYDSGTGWPSFWRPIDGAVGNEEDSSLLMVRTSNHCNRCGGHLGHVFDDGPQPTGLRYCMNGVALHFQPLEKLG